MTTSRGFVPRTLKFAAFLMSVVAVGALIAPLSLAPAPRRWHWMAEVLRLWARIVLHTFGIRRSEALESGAAPAGARVIVGNHVSYLDIPVLLARSRCLFLAKEEITAWPIMGWIARRSGMVFVKREDLWSRARSVLSIQERLQAGLSIVVFPEGTTSIEGPLLGRSHFFAGAFRAARMESCPIELVYLDYEDPEECAWVGDDEFLPHLWSFLGRKRTQVRVRSTWVTGVEDRAAQRRTVWFTRQWLLQSGRNLDLRPSPERAFQDTLTRLFEDSTKPRSPIGGFVESGSPEIAYAF